MVARSTVKAGDTLYDCHRYRMGNTSMTAMGTWNVKVTEVQERGVIASWNGNPAKFFGWRTVEKWRRSKPKPKS